MMTILKRLTAGWVLIFVVAGGCAPSAPPPPAQYPVEPIELEINTEAHRLSALAEGLSTEQASAVEASVLSIRDDSSEDVVIALARLAGAADQDGRAAEADFLRGLLEHLELYRAMPNVAAKPGFFSNTIVARRRREDAFKGKFREITFEWLWKLDEKRRGTDPVSGRSRPSTAPIEPSSCSRDADCPGERICESSRCVQP